jgi:hypothetical protein
VASFRFWETKPLRPNLLRTVSLDAALILIELILVLPVEALDDPNLLVGQTRDPTDDLVVGAPSLKVRNLVVNRNPAGGELDPSAMIDESDLFLRTLCLRACIQHEPSF